MGNKLERNALLLGVSAFLLLVFAIVITVAVPLMQDDLRVASAAAPRYDDPKVARGREIYIREGCFYCHTQQVRTVEHDAAFRAPAGEAEDGTPAGDRPTAPGDYAYDNPVLLGSERTGPDLKYVGHRLPSKDWHIAHLRDPRSTTPGSIMPSYNHLPYSDLDALAEYLLSLRDWSIPIKTLAVYPGPDILEATDDIIPEEYKDLENPFEVGDPQAVALAEKLIKEKACLTCHGQDMRGMDPSKGWATKPYPTDWYKASATHSEQFIYWIISEGTLTEAGTPSGMPSWRTLGLTDEERWALATYIKGLSQE